MGAHQIAPERTIVGFSVQRRHDEDEPEASSREETPTIERMHEHMERPECLLGATYQIKPPVTDHSIFVTINDVLLNQGTAFESRQPFEVFVNSKNMDQFQWVVALTRIISAVFRKGGNYAFLVDELRSVFDPRGGYFKPGGVYMPSVVAEIGEVIERHLEAVHAYNERLHQSSTAIQSQEVQGGVSEENTIEETQASENHQLDQKGKPLEGAIQCPKCFRHMMVIIDGCKTCLNCGDSSCS